MRVEYTNTKPPEGPEADRSQPALMRGVVSTRTVLYPYAAINVLSLQRLGGCELIDPEKAIEDAVALASKSDAIIVIAGLSPEWEAEGFDRPTLNMPGQQNELITRVGQANHNTVVCLQAVSIGPGDASPIDNLTSLLGFCCRNALDPRRQ